MVRRSNYSKENTPVRDGFNIISRPKKQNFLKSREFLLPLMCILIALAGGMVAILLS